MTIDTLYNIYQATYTGFEKINKIPVPFDVANRISKKNSDIVIISVEEDNRIYGKESEE